MPLPIGLSPPVTTPPMHTRGHAVPVAVRKIRFHTVCLADDIWCPEFSAALGTFSSESQPPTKTPKPRRILCPYPADPCRRHVGCNGEDFDWDEVLVSDWTGLRSRM